MSENIYTSVVVRGFERAIESLDEALIEDFVARAMPVESSHTNEDSPYNFLAGFLAVNEESLAHLSLVISTGYKQAKKLDQHQLGLDIEELRLSLVEKMTASGLDEFSGDLTIFESEDVKSLYLVHELVKSADLTTNYSDQETRSPESEIGGLALSA
ncbi:MAG: hypothetical protein WD061_02175 [Candidatus Saccharimonadales bacterium]